MIRGIMQKEASIGYLLGVMWEGVFQGSNCIGHGGPISHQARDRHDCI